MAVRIISLRFGYDQCRGGKNMPEISGKPYPRGQNLALKSVWTFARWGETCREFWETFAWVAKPCLRFGLDFTPVGILCPRFRADFCTGGKTLPEFQFRLLHGGV